MIRCPFCGSEELERFDEGGGAGEDITEFYTCLDCDKQFFAIYEYVRIEVDD